MKSIWQKEGMWAARETLRGSRKVDIAVIGGGMTGILTAYFLQKKGAQVLVLEQNQVGDGASGRTTGKITAGHGLLYDTLIRRFGEETARKYGELQELSIAAYEELIRERRIACHWERRPHLIYSRDDEKELAREMQAAKRLGLPVMWAQETELPFAVAGALCYAEQAQFHPMKFLQRMAEEVPVCENTTVEGIDGRYLRTPKGIVLAEQIVVASHYPIVNVPGYYFMREYQEKAYLLALSGGPKLEGMYMGTKKNDYTLRPYGDRILFGGEGSRTGKNLRGRGKLIAAAKQFYPGSRISSAWENQDGITMDDMPYVGAYSKKWDHIYVATGYGKWGMSQSMAAALLLSKELAGEKWDYSGVFSPQRTWKPAAFSRFFVHGMESAVGLVKGIGMMRSEAAEGKRNHRCTHMGCKLHWNPDEEVYECSCHGSRFDKEGRRLAGPAQKDLK